MMLVSALAIMMMAIATALMAAIPIARSTIIMTATIAADSTISAMVVAGTRIIGIPAMVFTFSTAAGDVTTCTITTAAIGGTGGMNGIAIIMVATVTAMVGATMTVTGGMATEMAIVTATMAMVDAIAGAATTVAGNMEPIPARRLPIRKAQAGGAAAKGVAVREEASVGAAGRAMGATPFPPRRR
jgi:hypothetical protein